MRLWDQRQQLVTDASICVYPVSIGCRNTKHWRVPHGRDDEITQRIMIGTLPLPATLTEANGGLGFPEIVRTGCPFPAQFPIGAKVKSQAGIGGVLVEGEQSKSGEVLGLVDFNERSCGRVIEVAGQTCEALIGLLIESSIQRSKDAAKHFAHVRQLMRKP